jgi:hypothetical protein
MEDKQDQVDQVLKLLSLQLGELPKGIVEFIFTLSVDQLAALAAAAIDWRRVDELMEWLEAVG